MIVGVFLLAGWVKGVVGMGLPTVAMGALGLTMPQCKLPRFSWCRRSSRTSGSSWHVRGSGHAKSNRAGRVSQVVFGRYGPRWKLHGGQGSCSAVTPNHAFNRTCRTGLLLGER